MCPRGHEMKGHRACPICDYRAPLPPPPIEIHHGGKVYQFANRGEALTQGFHLDLE